MRQVLCPTCGKKTLFHPDNKYRPFCSERCQTLDLGAWADESYRVPTEEPQQQQDLDCVNVNDEKPQEPFLN